MVHIDGLVKDCSNSSALAMELLQSCTKSNMCHQALVNWARCPGATVKATFLVPFHCQVPSIHSHFEIRVLPMSQFYGVGNSFEDLANIGETYGCPIFK